MKKIYKIGMVITAVIGVSIITAKLYMKQMWEKHMEQTKNLRVKYVEHMNDLEYAYGQDLLCEVNEMHFEVKEKGCQEYVMFYPANLSENYPVVIWGNGTGNTYKNYEPALKSLASYGFVVMGCTDSNMGSGKRHYEMAQFVKQFVTEMNEKSEMNETDGKRFEQADLATHMDVTHMGIAGHSQGACGAVNAIAKNEDGNELFQSLFTTSMPKLSMCVNRPMMKFAYWKYDITKVQMPYFATSGTKKFDSKYVSPLSSMKHNYEKIHTGYKKVMARQIGANHNIVNEYHACGYFNAWFCYTLKDDEKAKMIFEKDGELSKNTFWSDVFVEN